VSDETLNSDIDTPALLLVNIMYLGTKEVGKYYSCALGLLKDFLGGQ
jgi:hypothetical protein